MEREREIARERLEILKDPFSKIENLEKLGKGGKIAHEHFEFRNPSESEDPKTF